MADRTPPIDILETATRRAARAYDEWQRTQYVQNSPEAWVTSEAAYAERHIAERDLEAVHAFAVELADEQRRQFQRGYDSFPRWNADPHE